jgi:hypothetical protein
MTETKHTPAPWFLTDHDACTDGDREKVVIRGQLCDEYPLGIEVCSGDSLRRADRARIVQCVNACEGIEDPAAAIELLKSTLRDAASNAGDAITQRKAVVALRALGG